MNFTFRERSLSSLLKERNLALGCCLALGVSNVLLVVGLLNQEEKWVLMPQYADEHRLEVTRSHYSDEYLIDWATGVLNTFLCANPQSIDWKISQILKISLRNYGPLRAQLTQEAKKIKEDKVSTVFYPNTFKVNQKARTVQVMGEYSAYFGGDAAPVVTQKTFQLTWSVRGHGVILLEGLKEVTNREREPK